MRGRRTLRSRRWDHPSARSGGRSLCFLVNFVAKPLTTTNTKEHEGGVELAARFVFSQPKTSSPERNQRLQALAGLGLAQSRQAAIDVQIVVREALDREPLIETRPSSGAIESSEAIDGRNRLGDVAHQEA